MNEQGFSACGRCGGLQGVLLSGIRCHKSCGGLTAAGEKAPAVFMGLEVHSVAAMT